MNGFRTYGVLMAALLAVAAGCAKSGEKGGPQAGAQKPPVPVKIAASVSQTFPVELHTFGTVEARSTIQVKAQVSGELTKVWFAEGDYVEKDQVLFTVDPRPYEIALKQAETNLAKSRALEQQAKAMLEKDRAQARNAKVEFDRNASLLAKKMVSQEEHDRSKTNAEALEAAAGADEASIRSASEAIRAAEVAIEDAKLRLEYCTIKSPIAGRTGSLLIYQGNIVKANDTTPMVTITEVSPIFVSFTLPEQHLFEIRQLMEKGPLEVEAHVPEDPGEPVGGVLTFLDNEVDTTAGTFRMKATYENADHRLWPGQYVDVALRLMDIPNAITVPSQAIQTGQKGTYVYVVKPDMTVELRVIKPGKLLNGIQVIAEGLQAGENVIIDGHVRVAPGATVRPVDGKEAKEGASSAEGKPGAAPDAEPAAPSSPAAENAKAGNGEGKSS